MMITTATYAGFTLEEERTLHECDTLARLWRHTASGASLLSLVNDDENKVFGVTLRTPPENSTGVAHILEHSVLCGSRKYSLKEPFVELLKGSLKTFLNAFTYPDKTCYPVASTNLQDFYNLIDVYLDAVFHPLIPEHTFRQEGWRLHPAPEAPHGFIFKGVVFNEMKGAYSSPDSQLYEKAQQTLYPDTVYGLDSGGAPEAIPDLDYKSFKAFHETYYHPSNARFFFHGNDPEEKRLEMIDAVIAPFGALDVSSEIKPQKPFTAPHTVHLPYPADDADPVEDDHDRQRCMMVVSWLFPDPPNVEQALAWQMLETMLVGLPGAPLRKALLDSGLGEDLAGVGLESELLQSYFSTGLKGIAKEHEHDVEDCILRTLTLLADNGFAPELVEAAVNSAEFDLRENNTGRFPRGLHLMLRSLSRWLYGENPLDVLAFEAPLRAIKQRLAAGERYFETLVETLLLDNPHRVTLVLEPDAHLAAGMQAEEQERIAAMVASLDAKGREELNRLAEELQKLQQTPDSPEELAKLPRLTLADLPRENRVIPREMDECGGVPLLRHDLGTNGLLYLDLCFDLRPLLDQRPGLLPLAPLFSRALLEMGTKRRDYVDMSTLIARKTGGIDASPFTIPQHGSSQAHVRLAVRGKSTLDHAEDMGGVLEELLSEARFDDSERLRQLVQEELAGMEERIAPMGHRVALSRATARHSESGLFSEFLSGVNQLSFLRRLAKTMKQDMAAVQQALEDFRLLVLNRANLLCNVTLPENDMKHALAVIKGISGALPHDTPQAPPPAALETLLGSDYADLRSRAYALDALMEGLHITSQVNYVAKAANLYDYGYQFNGAALVGMRLLSTGWLWDKVRVQGGAYGAFCQFDRFTGTLAMASYRDPNLEATLAAFDNTVNALAELAGDRAGLESGIIGTVGDLDEHLLPDAKGYTSLMRWLMHDSDAVRQEMREQILTAGAPALAPFQEALHHFAAHGNVCVLGPKNVLEAAAGDQWRLSRLL